MANYRTHATINLALTLPVFTISAALLGFPHLLILIFIAVFAYGTLFAHPDMDLAYQTKLLSVRGILTLPFRSYARLFRHRGLSHSFLFGTLTRVVWVGLQVLAVLFLIYQIRPTDRVFMRFLQRYQEPLIAAGIGLLVADWSHLIIDKIWSFRKRH